MSSKRSDQIKVKAKIQALKHQIEFANIGIVSPDTFRKLESHDALIPDRLSCLLGGYGSGKSKAVPARSLNLLKYRNILKQRADILIGAPTDTMLTDINIPDVEEFLDRYRIRYDFAPHSKRRIIRVKTPPFRGKIRFKSGHIPDRMVGFNSSDFIFDEFDIVPYKNQKILFTKLLARIREVYGATGALATTPEGFKYTYELFEAGIGEEGKKKTVGRMIRAKTTDNHFLPHDYIESLQAIYDPQLLKQYMNAEFVNINGMSAYYNFSREASAGIVIPFEKLDPQVVNISIDFNVDPLTATCWVKDGQRSIAFEEFFLHNSYTERLIEVIKGRFPNKPIICHPDMTGVGRHTSQGGASRSDVAQLRNAGFTIRGTSNPLQRDRLACMNNAFAKGLVQIMENCSHLIKDCEQVTVNKYGEIDQPPGTMLTHSSDNAGYYVSNTYPIRGPRVIQL